MRLSFGAQGAWAVVFGLGLGLAGSAMAQSSTSFSLLTSSTYTTSTTATSTATSPSTPGATAQSSSPTVELPPLVACSFATFSFTIPEQFVGLPKHLGFYPSSTSSWIETFDLPAAYNPLTIGSFTWLVDLPVGLSVAAMFYVTDPARNGAIPTNGSASTADGVVLAGTSNDCLAQNGGASTTQVVSYASRFDPTFVWSAGARPTGATTPGSPPSNSGSSTPIGPIIGGVVGGIAAILAIALILLYLRRKHKRSLQDDGYSMYSSTTAGEKRRRYGTSSAYPASAVGVPASEPPPGTYWGMDENGHTVLLALPDQARGQQHAPTEVGSEREYEQPASPAPRVTAASGTLPEPMGDESSTLHRRPSFVSAARSATPPPSIPGSPFLPQQEAKAYVRPHVAQHDDADPFANAARGAEGLDDPSSFSPSRQTTQRSDTGFFTAESGEAR